MLFFLLFRRRPGLAIIERDRGADEILYRRLIQDVAVVDIDGATRLSFEAGIENTFWVAQGCALEKIHLDMIGKGPDRYNISFVRPYRCVPFPLFNEARSCVKNRLAQMREHLAAPTGNLFDVASNLF